MSGFDFKGAQFNLYEKRDRDLICFMLSQALYGEATGVYCGKSLYSARSIEAAKFYIKQAKQEINHLQLFAEIFRELNLEPQRGHWVIRLLSSHNNYYPLKVFLEHAMGEGMVLDVFREVLLQTLPDEAPLDSEDSTYIHPSAEALRRIKRKLRVVCKEEEEHVAWGEKETRLMLQENPHLQTPMWGLLELQLMVAPLITKGLGQEKHPVLSQLNEFIQYVIERSREQAQSMGVRPKKAGTLYRYWAMFMGIILFIRSQFATSHPILEKNYLNELGFETKNK